MKARLLFGQRLRYLRTIAGLTQNDLGFKTGIDRSYLSNIETGDRNVSIDIMEKLADALGVAMKELFVFDATEKRPRPPKKK